MWNFQAESIKYCEIDCESLHQVITQFSELIYKEFKVNAHNSLTLPSLAMKIYKTHYMPENSIYQLVGIPEFNIRQSYSGGSVDVYIPHNKINSSKYPFKGLYSYDVNSLYPFIMANHKLPIGKPIVFEGDIRKVESDAYGFFYVNIRSPEFMQHPILQRRIKTAHGYRTIAGLGSWTAWICSSEMDNAMKYGYQFEIIKGYQYKTGYIFKEYVEQLYNLRLSYPKTNPMNLIAKLLMNSLYGKLGMKSEMTEVEVFNCSTPIGKEMFDDKFKEWAESIIDHKIIGDHQILVRHILKSYKYDESSDLYHGQDINVALASAITAGARNYMSYFKNNPKFNLYYSDTDSVVIDSKLPAELVGKDLGQLKLEHIIKRAVFLAPKVYGFEDINNKTTIKIKGVTPEVSENITLKDLELLLIEDSNLEFKQFKWFKKVLEGEIEIKEVVYHLKTTSNKRAPIYKNIDGLNIFTSTRPYNYKELT